MAPDRTDPAAMLSKLYDQTLAETDHAYLRTHSSRNSVRRQVDAFRRYQAYLPRRGAILDWGCFHAPDSCMIRQQLGDQVELDGCDLHDPGICRRFHDAAGLQYLRLAETPRLPYPDQRFHAVVGSGVLEHVAVDLDALKELHRVLRPDGVLILTFLPNRWSYIEWCCRRLRLAHHQRLYAASDVRRLLLHHGFEPLRLRYHQFIPAHRMQPLLGPLYPMNRLLDSVWPIRVLSTNIMVIARKRSIM